MPDVCLPHRSRRYPEHAAAACPHERLRSEVRLTPASLGQPQWHVDPHRVDVLDVIDSAQQCGQAIRDVRGGECAAARLDANPPDGACVDAEDPHAGNGARAGPTRRRNRRVGLDVPGHDTERVSFGSRMAATVARDFGMPKIRVKARDKFRAEAKSSDLS